MDRSTEAPSESKERAVSSEPCSTRPNPFDDGGSSARKRRRTSLNGVSPSRSVETPKSTHDTPLHSPEAASQAERDASMTMDFAPSAPRTPEPKQEQVLPASESKPTRITLNLKNRKQESHFMPSSPNSSNGADVELEGSRHEGIRLSVENSELDVSHTLPDFRDTGSPTLDIDNPPIEIIDDDDDDDDDDDESSQGGVPRVILLQDSDGEEPDPVTNFPYNTGDPVAEALAKLCQHMPSSECPHFRNGKFEILRLCTRYQCADYDANFPERLPRMGFEQRSRDFAAEPDTISRILATVASPYFATLLAAQVGNKDTHIFTCG